MKNSIISSLLLLVLFVSCAPELHTTDIKNTRYYDNKNESVTPKSPYNTKYSKRDIVGCLGATLLAVSVGFLGEFVSILFSGNSVGINFSPKLIRLVRKDVEAYIEKFGKIAPADFYFTLSQESLVQLELEMIKAYSGVAPEAYNAKKQMMAYAFLYFLETGDETGSYKFSFDGRKGNDNAREVIAFDASDKRSDSKEVGICGYVRFSDIEVKSAFADEVICVDDKVKNIMSFSRDADSYFLSITDTQEERSYELDANNMDESEDEVLIHPHKGIFSYPKITIEFDKRSQVVDKEVIYTDNSAWRANLEVNTGMFDKDMEYRNMSCREYGQFAF